MQDDHHKLQLPIVLSFLDDARRLIEGGKNRRWEVFKWTIALNVLLATAALTQRALPPIADGGLLVLAIAVALMGGFLIDHYDRRMTKARDRARALVEWIRTNASIDVYATMGEATLISPAEKDTFERYLFYMAIGASAIAVALALSLK